jgi:hypothetical protein
MMKKLCLSSSLLCFVIGMFICCNSETKNRIENDIRFDSLYVNKTSHLLDIETNPHCQLQISFIYPVDFQNKEILKLIQQQFISNYFGAEYADLPPKDAIDKYTKDYINNYRSQDIDFQSNTKNHEDHEIESYESYDNYEISENRITFNQNNLLSHVVDKEYYIGGAHGAHSITNQVIDLNTGRQILESDIFIDDYQDDLAKVIVDGIALSNNVNNAVELENIGFFNVDEIYPNKNFYVDETGITYTFNEYEIAAYVVGATSVQIPYEKIRHLLRKESPIAQIAF